MDTLHAMEDISLEELMEITRDFIELANQLYKKGKLTEAEYNELTFLKKDFLAKAEAQKAEEIEYRYF